jgi:hypothetical protein
MRSNILFFTSSFTAAPPYALRRETKLSINSREAISTRKWEPPFFTQVSVSYTQLVRFTAAGPAEETHIERAQLGVRILVAYTPLEGSHSLFRVYGLGAYDIGYFEVEGDIFSGKEYQHGRTDGAGGGDAYKLLSVAFWTCSSIWELDANQPAIMF